MTADLGTGTGVNVCRILVRGTVVRGTVVRGTVVRGTVVRGTYGLTIIGGPAVVQPLGPHI